MIEGVCRPAREGNPDSVGEADADAGRLGKASMEHVRPAGRLCYIEAMVKLYGAGGRTFRCLWMLEEAGLEYEREFVDFAKGDTRADDFLQINPNGKVPVLVDGKLVLFESLAINFHIARCYAPAFWPAGSVGQSEAVQWLAWAMGELEGPHDAANRAGTQIDSDALQRSLNALRDSLANQQFVLGERFTVVDLNTACVLLRPQYRPVAEADPELSGWFQRCTARAALKRATAERKH